MNDQIRIIDARSLSPREQEDLRKKVVLAVESGWKIGEVADLFGITRQSVGKWVKVYRERGTDALRSRKRGHEGGEPFSLEQRELVIDTILNHTPNEEGLSFSMWTRRAVAALILKLTGVPRSRTTAGRYLKKWGLTPQRPKKKAREQDPNEVKKWVETGYERIREDAERDDAEIFFVDEVGLRSDHLPGRSYGLCGQTPVVPTTGKRFRANAISAMSPQGRLKFMAFEENFRKETFLEFLTRMVRDAERKIILVLDRHPAHLANVVKEWISSRSDRVEMRLLPSYSPELNPVELLNQDVKSHAMDSKRPENLGDLLSALRSRLRSRQRKPQIVKNFFQNESVRYAAS